MTPALSWALCLAAALISITTTCQAAVAAAGGTSCARRCFQQARPNSDTGVSYLAYNSSCRSGGLGCLSTQDGCQFCRLADTALEQHLPVCPPCVCQHYGLAGSRCGSSSSSKKPVGQRPAAGTGGAKAGISSTGSSSSITQQHAVRRPRRPVQWGQPVLVETFSSGSLNRSLFDVEVDCWGGGNGERQCYVDRPENLRVEGGRLVLEARRGDYTGSLKGCTNNFGNSCTNSQPFTSARVRTKASRWGSWRYGRVEVRAQMPAGDFLWPAIWMLPTDNKYGTWAASGEIDIVEFRGQAGLHDTIEGTLHYGGQWPHNTWKGSGRQRIPGVNFSAGMHDFVLEWTAHPITGRPADMRWYVDGRLFHEQRLDVSWSTAGADLSSSPYTRVGQPWDQRFHLIINLAVGGGFFPPGEFGAFDGHDRWDRVAAGWARPRLEIEHVKVWAWPPRR